MTNAGTASWPPATPLTEAGHRGFWRRYGARWPRAGREILGLIALFVLACAAYSVSWGLFSAGIGLLAAFLVGVFVLVAALYVARGLGTADLAESDDAHRRVRAVLAWLDSGQAG